LNPGGLRTALATAIADGVSTRGLAARTPHPWYPEVSAIDNIKQWLSIAHLDPCMRGNYLFDRPVILLAVPRAGSGAFSYLNGTMYANTFALGRYGRMIHKTGAAITVQRRLSEFQQARYDIVMTLFGLSLKKAEYREKYDGRFFRLLRKELLTLRHLGATVDDCEHIQLTSTGQYLWVIMMREFFTGVNNFRDQMREHVRAERLLHR
jgi:hypothetical protein